VRALVPARVDAVHWRYAVAQMEERSGDKILAIALLSVGGAITSNVGAAFIFGALTQGVSWQVGLGSAFFLILSVLLAVLLGVRTSVFVAQPAGHSPVTRALRLAVGALVFLPAAIAVSLSLWFVYRAEAISNWSEAQLKIQNAEAQMLCRYDPYRAVDYQTIVLKSSRDCLSNVYTYVLHDVDYTDSNGRLLPKYADRQWPVSYRWIGHYPEVIWGDRDVITYLTFVPDGATFSAEYYWKPLHPNWPDDRDTTDEELTAASIVGLAAFAWKAAAAFLGVAMLWIALIRWRDLRRGLRYLAKQVGRRGGSRRSRL
jgi:hypothetical protein